jgi:hypothetical protein
MQMGSPERGARHRDRQHRPARIGVPRPDSSTNPDLCAHFFYLSRPPHRRWPQSRVPWVRKATIRREAVAGGYVRSTYSEDEIDLLGVYCGELDRCFLLPVSLVAGKQVQYLRLTPPRNSQRACITLAENFAFEGAIAQLGERRHGMAEVVGSSPTSSTSSRVPPTVGSNSFRDRLGDWMD